MNNDIKKVLSELKNIITSFSMIYDNNLAERNSDVIFKRFGFEKTEKQTLEEIGIFYGITRERVRQIEEKKLDVLSLLITQGYYVKKFKKKEIPYYLEGELFESIQRVITSLELDKFYLTVNKLEQVFNINYLDFIYKGELDLLLSLLGYHKLSSINTYFDVIDGWIFHTQNGLLESAIEIVTKAVNREILEIPTASILTELKKQGLDIELNRLQSIIRLINGVVFEDDTIKINLNYLSSINKAHQILKEKGILSVSEITQLVNLDYHKIVQETNLRNQMCQDTRFEPIGKSGKWQLASEGCFNNIKITDAMEKILLEKGEPQTIQELYAEIVKIRGNSFKEKSIRSYVSVDKRFNIVGSEKKIALAIWNLPTTEKKAKFKTSEFNSILVGLFATKRELLMIDIVHHFMNLNWKEQTVRSKLNLLKKHGLLIDVENTLSSSAVQKVLRLSNQYDLDDFSVKRVLLRDKVQAEIMNVLQNHLGKIKKRDLYLKIIQKVNCNQYTFYTYLSEMKSNPNLRFTQDKNNSYVELIH